MACNDKENVLNIAEGDNMNSNVQQNVHNIPEGIAAAANAACLSLLPAKSRVMYEKAYKHFCEWKSRNAITEVNETAVLAFFYEKVC